MNDYCMVYSNNFFLFLGGEGIMHDFKSLLLIVINKGVKENYRICPCSVPLKKNSGYIIAILNRLLY